MSASILRQSRQPGIARSTHNALFNREIFRRTRALAPSFKNLSSVRTGAASLRWEIASPRSFHSCNVVCSYNGGDGKTKSKIDEIFEKIVHLDLVEVHLLTQLINKKMGIHGQDVARMGSTTTPQGGDASPPDAPEESKTAFDLKLVGFDASSKIKIIKEVRAITGLGLKEAKSLVEGVPSVVKKDMKKEEVDELKSKLEAIGGSVEIV